MLKISSIPSSDSNKIWRECLPLVAVTATEQTKHTVDGFCDLKQLLFAWCNCLYLILHSLFVCTSNITLAYKSDNQQIAFKVKLEKGESVSAKKTCFWCFDAKLHHLLKVAIFSEDLDKRFGNLENFNIRVVFLRQPSRTNYWLSIFIWLWPNRSQRERARMCFVCVCVCMCVWERERGGVGVSPQPRPKWQTDRLHLKSFLNEAEWTNNNRLIVNFAKPNRSGSVRERERERSKRDWEKEKVRERDNSNTLKERESVKKTARKKST